MAAPAALTRAGVCRGCSAPILWIQRAGSAAWHPVDPERLTVRAAAPIQTPSRTLRLVLEDGTVRTIRPGDVTEPVIGYISHWATCPRAADFR